MLTHWKFWKAKKIVKSRLSTLVDSDVVWDRRY